MIVVVGGGLAGLTVARELACAGQEVTVLEERGNLGGLIPGGPLAGVQIDLGADAYTTRASEVTEYIHSLGLETMAPSGRSWIWNGSAFPMPANASLGVPADPHSAEVAGIVDIERVARDEQLPPEIGREAKTLGELVRLRMGDELVEKLVAPIVSAIYSTHPDNLALDPTLKKNFLEYGSLAQAVATGLSGPAIATVVGGMHRLPQRLAQQAQAAGAQIRTGAKVVQIGRNSVTIQDAGTSETIRAAHIVMATGVARAAQLLPGVMEVEPFELPKGRLTTHVTLALDTPELASGPRGSGMLCVAGTSRAKAITHMSHKWQWLREESELEFVRVSYPVNAPVPVEDAVADAATLLGVPLRTNQVVDSYLLRWGGALTPATPQLRAWAARLAPPPNVSITGVWKAGSGISAVIPHARQTAQAILAGQPAGAKQHNPEGES